MSTGSSSGTQTVDNTQTMPLFEQQFSEGNENVANSLMSNPYPNYSGQLLAPLTSDETGGITTAEDTANSYTPYYQNATNQLSNADNYMAPAQGALTSANSAIAGGSNTLNSIPSTFNQASSALGSSASTLNQASAFNPSQLYNQQNGTNFTSPGVAESYMSPYESAALSPELSMMQDQLTQQNNQSALQSAGEGALGGARAAATQGINTQNADLQMSNVIGQGYNTAYSDAMTGYQNQQQDLGNSFNSEISGQGTLGQIGSEQTSLGNAQTNLGTAQTNLGTAQAGIGADYLNAGNFDLGMSNQAASLSSDSANLGTEYQTAGQNAANELYNAGSLEQAQTQAADNIGYENFENQSQWPYQMLNVGESAVSNTPYTIANQLSVPSQNPITTGLSSFSSLAGALGSLTGSKTGSTTTSSTGLI